MCDRILLAVGVLLVVLPVIASVLDAHHKVDEMKKKLDDHAHRLSPGDVGTKGKPTTRDEVNVERLIAAVRGLGKNKALDAETFKRLSDAAADS